MSELIVFAFRDEHRAPEVLNELRRRDWDWVINLDDALIVTINKEGQTKIQLSFDLSSTENTASARMWGSFLEATLFIPLTDVMVEATDRAGHAFGAASNAARNSYAITPDARWWKEALNLQADFLRDVGAIIARGGSAIFMLLRTENPQDALLQLRDYGGTILRTSLAPEQDAMLQQSLHDNGHI